jgi:hypothetical protein
MSRLLHRGRIDSSFYRQSRSLYIGIGKNDTGNSGGKQDSRQAISFREVLLPGLGEQHPARVEHPPNSPQEAVRVPQQDLQRAREEPQQPARQMVRE